MSKIVNKSHQPVHPALPLAAWIGGKRKLSRQLCERIAAVEHTTYAEPFVGMGGVFLRRAARPKAELINDINRDVWTLFRVVQEHYGYFVDYMKFRLTSRAEFQRLCETDPKTLTDLQRAARFLYVQRTCYGGRGQNPTFTASPGYPARFNVTKLVPMLEDVHERLSGVVVECLPWQKFMERYDRPDTLFYLDPPYWNCEGYYGPGIFSKADFETIAEFCRTMKGRFILSINDVPEIRDIFQGFDLEEVQLSYTVNTAHGRSKQARELIISN